MKTKQSTTGGMKGNKHGGFKLTPKDAKMIRQLRNRKRDPWTYEALATRFGVTKGMIYNILSGRSWKEAA